MVKASKGVILISSKIEDSAMLMVGEKFISGYEHQKLVNYL